MEIKTKFIPRRKVWFMANNMPQREVVDKIKITVIDTLQKDGKKGFKTTIHIVYVIGLFEKPEAQVFETKEDLLKSL